LIAFFNVILSISTFGASITLNYLQPLYTEPGLHLQHTLTVEFHRYGLPAFYSLSRLHGRRQRLTQWVGVIVSALLYSLVVAAFVFLSLIATTFASAVGWTAVAFIIAFGVFGLACIAYQAPFWSKWSASPILLSDVSTKLHPNSRARFEPSLKETSPPLCLVYYPPTPQVHAFQIQSLMAGSGSLCQRVIMRLLTPWLVGSNHRTFVFVWKMADKWYYRPGNIK
jgi:hypothetical protein